MVTKDPVTEPAYFPFDDADGAAIVYWVPPPCAMYDGEAMSSLLDLDLARGERAAALAVLLDGVVTPATMAYARTALGRTRAGFAEALSSAVSLGDVEAWERGIRRIDPRAVSRTIDLLRDSDLGGLVAERVRQ